MALTKVTGQVVNDATDVTVGVLTVSGISTFTGRVAIGTDLRVEGSVSVGGTVTYEDVTNVNSIGDITVGSGITLSKDGDIFFTGIMTGNGAGLTGVANTDVIFTDKITLPDSAAGSINVGLGSDLQIYHDGSNSYIKEAGTGNLQIQSANVVEIEKDDGTKVARFHPDGAVQLYNNGNVKLETASGGVTVTGTVAATSYTGDGSSLTGIEVGVATEAASISGITTYLNLSKDDHELVVTGTNTISVIGGAQGTSHTLRLQNSGIATVTLDSTYFKFASGATPAFPTSDGAISLVSFTVHKAGAVGVNTVLLTGASVSFS